MDTPILYRELTKFLAGKLSTVGDKVLRHAENRKLAADFNGQTAKRFHPLEAKSFFDALSSQQIADLGKSTNVDAQAILTYARAGLELDVEPGTTGRARINAMEAADPTLAPIATAIKKAADEQYPLWQKQGCEREANAGDVAWIRKQEAKANG